MTERLPSLGLDQPNGAGFVPAFWIIQSDLGARHQPRDSRSAVDTLAVPLRCHPHSAKRRAFARRPMTIKLEVLACPASLRRPVGSGGCNVVDQVGVILVALLSKSLWLIVAGGLALFADIATVISVRPERRADVGAVAEAAEIEFQDCVAIVLQQLR